MTPQTLTMTPEVVNLLVALLDCYAGEKGGRETDQYTIDLQQR